MTVNKSYLAAFLIAAAAAAWIASGVFSHAEKDEHVPAAEEKTDTVPRVTVVDLLAETTTGDIVMTGRTEAVRRVDLKAETEGRVVDLPAHEGDAVEEDAPLVRLDERDRRARVAEAAQRIKQRDIEFEAAQALEKKGLNSRVRLAQAQAEREAARAALKEAQMELDNTEITAPFAGIVSGRFVETGDYVTPGQNVMSLVDLGSVKAGGFVTEHQVGTLAAGQKASVKSTNGTKREGTVTFVSPAADPQTRTFRVDVTVPNPDGKLVDGMTVTISIAAQEEKAHKIPPSSLSLDDTGRIGVKIADAQNKVAFMPVTVLRTEPGYLWIGGLPDKVRVITVGHEFVTPGQTVEAVPAAGKSGAGGK